MIKKRKRYVMSASLIFTAFSPTNLRGDRYEKKPILFSLVACAAFGTAYFAWQWRQGERGEVSEGQAITAFGNVDIRQVDLGFRAEGRLQQLFLEEGDFVKAGELRAILDSEPFEEEIALQKAELSSAQSEFERLQAGFGTQEIKVAQAAVVERQATLSNLRARTCR